MEVNTIKKILYFVVGLSMIISCDEKVEFREPTSKGNSVPQAVSDILVENLPGKAKITYSVPKDPNLLYVKAVYALASGAVRVAKTSYYENELLVEGYADTLVHEVSIYSVSRNEVESEPVVVKVKPLEAPIWKVLRSIEVINTFGGYNLTAENPDEEDISILVMKKNDFNEFEVDNFKSVYTSLSQITSKIRGLDTITYDFRIFVRDKWNNSTDTLSQEVLPLFETELPKQDFSAFVLPGDAPQVKNGARLEYAWDTRLGWPYTSFTLQSEGGPDPHMVTIDLGISAKLSRFWYRPYPEFNPPQYFYLTTMKRFEIYGSNEPALNGALDDSWTLIGDFVLEKPSGSPYGADTAEDREAAEAGFDFEFDINTPKVRYIRIRCLENYAGGTAQSINELSVYGDPR